MSQPIIRGIQAVGQVSLLYQYNSADHVLPIPPGSYTLGDGPIEGIKTGNGIELTGFQLDSEFIRAAQQIATSVQVPLLGGGAMALTNNNRSGTLTFSCTRVSYPDLENADHPGRMYGDNVKGVVQSDSDAYYDIVQIAQIQQAAAGGDSVGATLIVKFMSLGFQTEVGFEGCTVAEVAPLALAGNNVPDYRVVWNYLNWYCKQTGKTDLT